MMQKILRFWHAYLFTSVSSQGFRLMRILWACTVIIKMLPFVLHLFPLFAGPQQWGQAVYIHPYRTTVFLLSDHPVFVACIYALLLLACASLIADRFVKIAMPIALVAFISFYERNLQPFHSECSMLSTFGFITLLFTYFEDKPHKMMPIFLWRLLVWQVVIMYGTSIWYKVMSDDWQSGHAVASALIYWGYFPTFFASFVLKVPTILKVMTYAVLVWEMAWFLLFVPSALWKKLRLASYETTLRRFLLIVGIVMHGSWAMLLREVYPLSFAAFAAYAGLLQPQDFKAMVRIVRGK